MNAQPTTKTQPGTAIAAVTNPVEALKPLLDANGELDLQALQFGERLQKLQAFLAESKYNMPLLEANILSQMPKGSSFVPIPVIPTKADCWHGDDARKMKLKEGHVEPSANFNIKLANMLDIKLVEVFAGVTNDTGSPMYAVRYNAGLQLPNGELLTAENEGKDQELYNSVGKQAHIVESTRKKAKRNAIKNLLNIPTSMPEEEFLRPWILLRPVFRPGISEETDAIIASRQIKSEEAKAMLYGGKAVDPQAGEVTDIKALFAAIESAQNLDELMAAQKRVAAARITSDERLQLGAAHKARKHYLETGEIPHTPASEQTVTVSPDASGQASEVKF